MAGRYSGSYLDRSNGWRAVAILAETDQASLVGRIPQRRNYALWRGDRKIVLTSLALEGELDNASINFTFDP
jgi:hypothetical protein